MATVHLKTKNISFLKYAAKLKKKGIKNHSFCLALHDPRLEHVDPRDEENLTLDQMIWITREVTVNPWYYFREVAVAPASSGLEPVRFRADRMNMSMYWSFFAGFTDMIMVIALRQVGKSFSSDVLDIGLLNYWTFNTNIQLLTKDNGLRMENIDRLKKIENSLPKYLRMQTKKDANNTQMLTRAIHNNKYLTTVAQKSEIAANNAARGFTAPIFKIDEGPFISFIDKMLPAALAAGGNAREAASRSGFPTGTIITTTAGDPTTRSGEYMYNIYQKAAVWTDSYLDCNNKTEARNLLEHNAKGNTKVLLIEMNHRQLGFDDKWLANRIAKAAAEGADAERDFMSKWTSTGDDKPFDVNVLKIVSLSSREPVHTEIIGNGFIFNWYITPDEKTRLEKTSFICGIDTSDLIGSDSFSLVMVNAFTGTTIGTGSYDTANIDDLSDLLITLLLKYKNMTILPERRSSAMSVVDTTAKALIGLDINPFKRIFNKIIQHGNQEEIREVLGAKFKALDAVYVKHKKAFGYSTSGQGEHSRINLYGRLEEWLRIYGSYVYDKKLIKQIETLRQKNGRIDHGYKNHDDLVIAFMLSHYFLEFGDNLDYYGFNPSLVLSNVQVSDVSILESKKRQREIDAELTIRNEISDLLEVLRDETNDIRSMQIESKIKALTRSLEAGGVKSMNINNRIEEIIAEKKKKQRRF
jgi:hypothetical protein